MKFASSAIALLVTACMSCAVEPKRAGPDWWSLQPLRAPATDDSIDRFIRTGLDARVLKPAAAADARTLIRRATFDLTGLPPTPAEIDAFLVESRTDAEKAYRELIDRLLASPRYGERWGRHWLDAVRFGESHGFERDQPRDHAWHYRDYVIKAFNDDKPYADFIREQIAGDVLPTPSREGVIATGFLVAGPWDQVGQTAASPSVRSRAREDELEEILGTVGQTFLGLTVNCARCHDHKFDPLTAVDYYRMKAIFEGVAHGDRPLPLPADLLATSVELKAYQARVDQLLARIAEMEKAGRARIGQAAPETVRPYAQWRFVDAARDQVGAMHGTLQGDAKIVDGRLILDGTGAYLQTEPIDRDLHEKTLEAWVSPANLDQRGGGIISIETTNGQTFDAIVFGESQPRHWMLGSNQLMRTQDFKGTPEKAEATERVHVAVATMADGRIEFYRNGKPYGKGYDVKPTAFKKGSARVLIGKRHTGGGNAHFNGSIEEARIYDRALSAGEIQLSFKAGPGKVSHQELLKALTTEERKQLDRLEAELTALRGNRPALPPPTKFYAAIAKQPGPTHLLKRGDPDAPAERLSAGSPASIKGPKPFDMEPDVAESERRLQLAKWIAHQDNPLTWRVLANRLWQHHFGDGIVRTPNDFGFNGDRPSHPELLDFLAITVRDNGGRLKPLHRQIMLSNAYRQTSTPSDRARQLDADNRMLSYYPARRLEAEAVRDSMLAISGQLNPQMGGPSYRPFKIEVFNSTFYRLIDADTPELNRRSVYRMVINSARDPLLDALDCPDSSVKTPRRAVTTTPLQALAMMNNSFVQRQANTLAERLKREVGEDMEKQITLGYHYALGRGPTNEEATAAHGVAMTHGLRAVCWALFNSSEFVTVR